MVTSRAHEDVVRGPTSLPTEEIEMEQVRAVSTPLATHLTFRVC